ncbi:MAG TPA: hypothetical protein ENN12_04515 [Epsilonproteobacteria bacterium]|nr:hypothetical protein [Campylobacterota bacterium]
MEILTSDYIILKEINHAIDQIIENTTKSSKRFASSMKTTFANISTEIGNTKVVDKRILPISAKKFLSQHSNKVKLTDLNNTIPATEFMKLAHISELRFIPREMVVYSRSNKNYPVFIRLNEECMELIKKGKQFYYLASRKIGVKYKKKEEDLYFDKIIEIENRESKKVFYFGVW